MSLNHAQSFVGFSPSLHQDPGSMRPRLDNSNLLSSSNTMTVGRGIYLGAATQGEKDVERAVDAGLRTFGEASPFQWLAWQRQQQVHTSGAAAVNADGSHVPPTNMQQLVVLAGAEGASQMRLSLQSHEPGTAEQEQKKREWRAAQQHRTKTLHFLLLLNLNQGMDPPDYIRIEPYAKLQCWCDPQVAQAKMVQGSEAIGEALENQYKTVQKEGVYKRLMEAHVEDARVAMISARRRAKDGRLLLHYNGHGTPKATAQGELWFFNRDHTHYIPMPVKDITANCGSPSLYVLDCNGAGGVLNAWKQQMHPDQLAANRDIWLCACSEGGYLPSNPKLPADLLTSCLTTPVRMALVWYIYYSHRTLLLPDVSPDMVRNIPGDLANRKTMLGEIHWILTAVTDTIAWSVLPKLQFYSVFRTDPIVVKSLFRNFLLADKILRELDCTPMSHPPLPADTHLHAMWSTWEVTLESLLCQLPGLLDPATLKPKPNAEYKPTSFFHDQLTAFEVWLDVGNTATRPQQLPCLVLGLIQTSYRVRSLLLLCRYLDIPDREIAVTHSLYCGAIPYLSKLVSPNYLEVSSLLVVVWMQLMGVDPEFSCLELIRNQAWRPFLKMLQLTPKSVCIVNANKEQGGTTVGATDPNSSVASSTVTGTQQRTTPAMGASLPMNADGPMMGTTLMQNATTTGSATSTDPSSVGSPTVSSAPRAFGGTDAHQSPSPQASATAASANQPAKLYAMDGFTIHRYRAVTAYLMAELLERGGEQVWTWVWNNNLITITFQMMSDPNCDFLPHSSSGGTSSGPPVGSNSSFSNNIAGGTSIGSISYSGAGTAYQASGGLTGGMSPSVAASLPTAPGQGAGLNRNNNDQALARDAKLLQTWACLLQAKMLSCLTAAKQHAAMVCFGKHVRTFENLLTDHSPSLRSATVCLLGSYLGTRVDLLVDKESALKRIDVDSRILKLLIASHNDPSSEVRCEVLFAVCQILYWYATPTETELDEENVIRVAGLQLPDGEDGAPTNPLPPPGGQDNNYGFTIPQIDRGVQTQLRAGPAILDGQIGVNAAAMGESGGVAGSTKEDTPPYLTKNDVLPSPTAGSSIPWKMNTPAMAGSTPGANSPSGRASMGGAAVLSVMTNIVHDTCVVLARYLHHHDHHLVLQTQECLKLLRHRQQPLSQRLHTEAKRSMRGLATPRESPIAPGCVRACDVAEEEQLQERRNVTMMRQSVLSTIHRTYTPNSSKGSSTPGSPGVGTTTASPLPKAASAVPARRNRVVPVPRSQAQGGGSVAPSPNPATSASALFDAATDGDAAAPVRGWTTHALPLTAPEEVTAAQFRLLQPQVVHGDKFGRVSLSSLDALERISIIDQFTHEGGGKIQGLHLVNDLSVSPLVCLCDVWGTFALYPLFPDGSGLLNGGDLSVGGGHSFVDVGPTSNFIGHGLGQAPQYKKRSALMTMPQSSVLHPLDAAHIRVPTRVVSDYRPRDSSLFFSPCSSKIAWVSLEYQQLIASETLHSGAAVTAICVDKNEGRSSGGGSSSSLVYVGTNDGMVIAMDDRLGKLSKVSDWNNRESSSASRYGGSRNSNGGGQLLSSGSSNANPAILNIGVMSHKEHYLYVSTGTTMKVYDVRKNSGSGKFGVVYESELGGPVGSGSISSSATPLTARGSGLEDGTSRHGNATASNHSVASVSVGRMVPLWCSVAQDGHVDMFTSKGESLFPAPTGTTAASSSVGGGDQGTGGGPGSSVATRAPKTDLISITERSASGLDNSGSSGGTSADLGNTAGGVGGVILSGGKSGGARDPKPKVSVFSQEAVCCLHPTKPMVLTGTEIVVYQGH